MFEKNQVVVFDYNNDGVQRTLTIDSVIKAGDKVTHVRGYRIKDDKREGRTYHAEKMSNLRVL